MLRLLVVPLLALTFHGSTQPPPGTAQPLPPALRAQLSQHRWHRGCPVSLSQLRLLTVSYRGFDHAIHTGQLVVNASAAQPMLRVFARLYGLHFPIRAMNPLSDSGDNTAAFDCRDAASSPCPGTPPTHSWSEHAYGEAVDLDPTENPYTGCGVTRDRASTPYLNRSRHRPGMVTPAVVSAFASVGWGWGGNWSGTQDYMHFSANGH